MPNRTCKVCGYRGRTYVISVNVSHKMVRRQWLVEVCQSCWRVFEVMLDQAMIGMQPHLASDSPGTSFLV